MSDIIQNQHSARDNLLPEQAIAKNSRENSAQDQAPPQPKASILNASANIIKSGLGTGILFMPYGFMECGILLGAGFMIVTGFICYYCWSTLGKVIRQKEAEGANAGDYKDLTLERAGGLIFGDRAKIFLEVITLIFVYGTSLGYTIFIQTTMSDIISNPIYIQLFVFALYFPLSLFKQISKLAIFSHLALFSFAISIVSILIKSIIEINQGSMNFQINLFQFGSLPLYFGVFAFAYDINGVVTEVHASMEDKSKFDIVLSSYLITNCSLAILVGVLGYFAFGGDVNAVIFKSIGSMGGYGNVLSCLYSFSLVASILLYSFPIVNCWDDLICKHVLHKKESDQKIPPILMVVTRCVYFVSISVLGILIQQITNVFNILGCFFSVALTFISPLIMLEYIKRKKNRKYLMQDKDSIESSSSDTSRRKNKLNSILNISVMLFGIVGGVSGIVSTIQDMID